jgi:hypothetical protein
MASFIRKFGGQNGHDENASNNEGWKPGTRTAEPNSETITTNTGLPVWEHKFSETLGRDGEVSLLGCDGRPLPATPIVFAGCSLTEPSRFSLQVP